MQTKQYYVYIMANRHRTLYTGVTNDLIRRVAEHKASQLPSFTARYKINRLVHFEIAQDVLVAIEREKQIKSWVRQKKLALVEANNPDWKDLSDQLGF